jgi:hypothetical protein
MTDGMIGHGHGDARIPEINGALIGFRRWNLCDGRLEAPHKPGIFWDPGVNTAFCSGMPHPSSKQTQVRDVLGGVANAIFGGHVLVAGTIKEPGVVPHKDCHCGLYSYHTPEALGDITEPQHPRYGTVAGAVLLWGRIEVHEAGFRAEKSMPILLVETGPPTGGRGRPRPDVWRQSLAGCAERYGMGLVAPGELLAKALERGVLYHPEDFNDA